MKIKLCKCYVLTLWSQYPEKLFKEGQRPVIGVSFAKAQEEKLLSDVA